MNCVDIFSGCGGLTLGLHKAGIQGLFAIEKSVDAFETLKFNLIDRLEHFQWPKWLPQKAHDINKVLDKHQKELRALRGHVDLLAGGPPCQGFSLAGRRRNSDKRNKLVHSYIKMVDAIQPKCLLLENVKGFTIPFKVNGEEKLYSSLVVDELRKRDYDVAFKLLDFSRYGVPQKRTRFILIGVSKALQNRGVRADQFFDLLERKRSRFLQGKHLPEKGVSVRSAISDLRQKHRERFALRKSSTKRLIPDSPTPTLTTLPDDYIHYCEPRILTVREYARIQSFPDDYEFKGKYTTGGLSRVKVVPRYSQIGNAIPPLFGELAGLILVEMNKRGSLKNA